MTSKTGLPILYSFRRCPYAMRARLALAMAGEQVELREILLRDKAAAFLEASPKGTVPVMVLPDGQVIEESRDIMDWVGDRLDQRSDDAEVKAQFILPRDRTVARDLVQRCDSEFKMFLDRYKYPNRYEDMDRETARDLASVFLRDLDDVLEVWENTEERSSTPYGYADIGIAPFVRQFAHVDLDWFNAQGWFNVKEWLEDFKDSRLFASVMLKYPKWEEGDAVTLFPAEV